MSIRSQFPQLTSEPGTQLAFVGEAPGPAEVSKGYVFAGASGWLLGETCRKVGIERRACYLSNVLSSPYPGKDFSSACGGVEYKTSEAPFCYQPVGGKYLHPDFHADVRRLWRELAQVKPDLIVTLGGPAMWALVPGGPPQVKRHAGTVRQGYLGSTLSTYNPAAILRGTGARLKPEFQAHLALAIEYLQSGEIKSRLTDERIWLQPTLADLARFDRHLSGLAPGSTLSVDIETANGLIECVGYGAGGLTLVVPWHIDVQKNVHAYWTLPEEFLEAWYWQHRWLTSSGDASPTDWIATDLSGLNHHMERTYGLDVSASGLDHRLFCRRDHNGAPVTESLLPPLNKVMHNGVYDAQWLLVRGSIPVRGYCYDTRLEHYCLDLEAPKDLGGLAVRYFGAQHKHLGNKTEEGKRDA